jgi:hypothetical protein
MTTVFTCPDGHQSSAGDWCDVCGLPIVPAGGAPPPPPPSASSASVPAPVSSLSIDSSPAPAAPAAEEHPCPNCGTEAAADALFCENCGYDFTTKTLPPAPDPDPGPDQVIAPAPAPASGPLEWVAEVWIDPDWYAAQESDEACPSAGTPAVVALRGRSLLVGRVSRSRGIHPDVDCGADNGVSRRHAQLTTDGQRWWVEDLQSANGTYAGAAGAPLPTDPLVPGQRRELAGDERIYLGAWTRIVVRPATDDEKTAAAAGGL